MGNLCSKIFELYATFELGRHGHIGLTYVGVVHERKH